MTSGPGAEVRTLDGKSKLHWDDNLIDSIVPGEGDDVVTGRSVGDSIQATAGGADNIQSEGGDDFIYTLDGAGDDAISCGAGDDDAVVDFGESVDADCEDVDVP